ncbi:MAG: FAD-binding oxidoreductase [Gammaproteobacteria bacterium]|nr:FAD-binding oxidoreductase [Gammaproteobacteria bacterium]
MSESRDCVVIGAGIVGISCGLHLLEQGYRVVLYDPAPPGSMTSRGNAGGFGFTDVVPASVPGVLWKVPRWLLDPSGPLFISPTHFPEMIPWLWRFRKVSGLKQMTAAANALADILKSSMTDTRALLHRTRLNHLFVENGAVTVYRSRKSAHKDRYEWEVKQSMGVAVQVLNSLDEIREFEPALRNAQYGIYTPQWCSTPDPYGLATSLADYFCRSGGRIRQTEIASVNPSATRVDTLSTSEGESVHADHFIIAAGVWSGKFCKQLGENVLLESERGYNTTLPKPGIRLNREVIFGEEKFVATNIGEGLRIGGAAEFAGLRAPPNYRRSDKLVEIARRYLPGLDDTGGEKWMGQRPATPDSLPVIGRSGRFGNVYYAFGHGHAGLTMAATTGKLVAQLVSAGHPGFDIEPFGIHRFNS